MGRAAETKSCFRTRLPLSLSAAPVVTPHQLRLGDDVAFHRYLELRFGRARFEIELRVERIELEEIAMLAIGRALMSDPKLLLLDEPSLGLAPIIVSKIFRTIKEINREGMTVLLVEQNARAAIRLSHRGYVIENGNIALQGSGEDLLNNEQVRKAYLGES